MAQNVQGKVINQSRARDAAKRVNQQLRRGVRRNGEIRQIHREGAAVAAHSHCRVCS